jgi:predicted dehydrogenase
MARMIRWGIVGPGEAARDFIAGTLGSGSGTVLCIATRNHKNDTLQKKFPGIEIVDGYDSLLKNNSIDAVYISTPNNTHAEFAIRAAEAGKHILCEKPIALNAAEAEAMFEAAHQANTFLGEADLAPGS